MAISPQAMSVSNTGRKRRNPRMAELKAAYGTATEQVLARKRKEAETARDKSQQKQWDREYALGQKQQALAEQVASNQEKSGRIGMGIQLGGLGMKAAQGLAGRGITTPDWMGEGVGNIAGGLDLGAITGGGLLGAGAGQLVNSKHSWKKSLVGAGVGALASGAMNSFDIGSMLGGGFLGALGGFL